MHLAFGIAAHVMRIDREHLSLEMSACASQTSESQLERLGLSDSVSVEHIVHGLVGCDKRQSVGQFESLLAERTPGADTALTQCGFVYSLKSQPGLEALGSFATPAAQKIVGSQTNVLGGQ